MTENPRKIYPLFAQKIKEQLKDQILEIFDKKDKLATERIFKVIISFQNTIKRDNFIAKHIKLNNIKKFDIIPSIAVNLTENQIQDLQNDVLVNKIEEDQNLYLSMLDVNEIIGLNNYRKSKILYTGNNIVIGIIDNGINTNFETISGIIINKYRQSERTQDVNTKNGIDIVSHGTLMANLIGNQFLDYNDRIIGIAPNAKIYDFDISNLKEEYYISNILEVFDFILENSIKLDILLLPLTTLEPSDGKDILSTACNFLVDNGFIIICPAGNFGPESYTIGSPAAAEKVITIGALTKELTIAYYSGRGPTLDERLKPDLCLPGSKVVIPLSNELNSRFSGTSISAALGAGLVALLKEGNPNMFYKDVVKIFQNVSLDLNYENISQGYGTVNVMDIFKPLGYYQAEIKNISYQNLIRRSLILSFEIIMILIIIYFIVNFYNLIHLIYNLF